MQRRLTSSVASVLRLACSRPLPLLLVLTALFTLFIQSGELGTSDTTHRLQVTHALWTGQPQVPAADYPEFGVHGRGGRLYASYGIGQSLLMLPADLAGTAAGRLPLWRVYVQSQADPAVRSIVVSCSTNVLVNVLTALAAFRLLIAFGFSVRESVTGVLALLCATTHLHYAQNMTENNYIFLLTLAGFLLQHRWLLTGERRWLLWGSAALGLNLLTRITTALDMFAAGIFLLLAVLFSASLKPRLRALFADYLKTALPVYAVFVLLDRVYQFVRFGSPSGFWTSTYVGVLAKEQRSMDPSLPGELSVQWPCVRRGSPRGGVGAFVCTAEKYFPVRPVVCADAFARRAAMAASGWCAPRLPACMRCAGRGVHRLLCTLPLVGG